MRNHKYINNREELLTQGRSIVSESADNKFVHRVSMVNLMLSGFSAKELAKYCGESERTLQSWLKKVDEQGWEKLISKKQTGRPSRLSNQQVEEIRIAVQANPEQSGYNVWDGPTLSDYIKNQYGIEYGVRASQYLLHRMVYSLIRPQVYPSLEQPDDEAREAFKKTD